jgi:hypothetical protein
VLTTRPPLSAEVGTNFSGNRSVSIVRLRTQATEFVLLVTTRDSMYVRNLGELEGRAPEFTPCRHRFATTQLMTLSACILNMWWLDVVERTKPFLSVSHDLTSKLF